MATKKKQTKSKPKKLFMNMSATDMLSMFSLALPAIQAVQSGNIITGIEIVKNKYLALEGGRVTNSAAKATLATYGGAIVPKLAKKVLSSMGVRNAKI